MANVRGATAFDYVSLGFQEDRIELHSSRKIQTLFVFHTISHVFPYYLMVPAARRPTEHEKHILVCGLRARDEETHIFTDAPERWLVPKVAIRMRYLSQE
ncbi:hypothetical protein Tdes44962_MAKER05910 [Teratosphaeria destructans]|uniref:Uncharacterized protein n=1 Tax=Teratosphaeria destructans TaxID=418781 RepID=A0A9W7SIR3_9PEZI|nr:hypothetical protein Tdes44962_MAKER05910 [Teratosphaeria destructans]